MGYCVRGRVVTAPNQAQERAIYYASQPQVTYQALPEDIAYWGFAYTTLDGYWSFAPGYTITQSDSASCTLEKPPEPKYDCVNGACVLQSQYETPGIYESLEACQAECGRNSSGCPPPFKCLDPDNYCPPGKVCIPSSEWSQIEGLSSQLKSKNCS